MEADNEVIRSTFEEHIRYYSNLHDIAEFEDWWIFEANDKLTIRFSKWETWEGSELLGEEARLAQVKIIILARKDVLIADE